MLLTVLSITHPGKISSLIADVVLKIPGAFQSLDDNQRSECVLDNEHMWDSFLPSGVCEVGSLQSLSIVGCSYLKSSLSIRSNCRVGGVMSIFDIVKCGPVFSLRRIPLQVPFLWVLLCLCVRSCASARTFPSLSNAFSSGSFQSESSSFVCRLRIGALQLVDYVYRGMHSFRHVVDGLDFDFNISFSSASRASIVLLNG